MIFCPKLRDYRIKKQDKNATLMERGVNDYYRNVFRSDHFG